MSFILLERVVIIMVVAFSPLLSARLPVAVRQPLI